MSDDTNASDHEEPRPPSDGETGRPSAALVAVEPERMAQMEAYWNERSRDERVAYIDQIRELYKKIVRELFDLSDRSVGNYQRFSRSHFGWRKWMVVLTGGLAILNIIVTWASSDGWTLSVGPISLGAPTLSLAAAVYAAGLAIISNLESLHNHLARAQAFREVREVYLSGAREHEMFWLVHVRPFLDSPTACVNAARAYQRIVKRESEIRGQAKELIERSQTPETQPSEQT